MVELFKFRCYQCQKLIGAPASKFGKVVKCPRCGVELIVPSPDDEPEEEEEANQDAVRLEELGLTIVPERLSNPVVAPPSKAEMVGPDPIAFLTQVAETPDENPGGPRDDLGTGEPVLEAEPGSEELSNLPEPSVEPLIARPRGRRGIPPVGTSPRARDVVLPRTAAVAWALFALLGLAFAFTSGLFVGQRFGK